MSERLRVLIVEDNPADADWMGITHPDDVQKDLDKMALSWKSRSSPQL
jgi:hypothetical protein